MKELGLLIKRRRETAGYTNQREFADLLGKAQSWVSRLESGATKETPSPEDMAVISQALGLSVLEMLQAAGYDITTGNEGESAALKTVRPILESAELSQEQIDGLRRILLAFLNRPF